MPKCPFCGRTVLPPRRAHVKCRRTNQEAREQLADLADRWLVGELSADAAREAVARLERDAFLTREHRGEVLRTRFEREVREALDDSVLTVEEESHLGEFTDIFGIGRAELDRGGWFTRYIQSAALRDLLHGRLPQTMLPMQLEPGEALLWLFPTAQLTEGDFDPRGEEAHDVGSVRVSAGLYFRMADLQRQGGSRLTPVDVGALGVTNRYAHFAGRHSRLRLRLEDLEHLEPTERGVRFRRPNHPDKYEGFETGDGWFLVNLLTNAKNAQED